MRLSHFAPKMGLALLLSASCNDVQTGSGTDDKNDQVRACKTGNVECLDGNGPNPFWVRYDIKSSFTMHSPEWPTAAAYEITGFVKGPSGDWIVRGYHVTPGALNPTYANYDGKVSLRTADTLSHRIIGMKSQPDISTLAITYCDDAACSSKSSVEGKELTKIALDMSIPGPGGRGQYGFTWTFQGNFAKPSVPVDPWFEDTTLGVMVLWTTKGVDTPTPLCTGAAGVPKLIVPQGGAMWDPATFARIPNDKSVTIACETGAIAECTGWGYNPGLVAKMKLGGSADLVQQRDTCIQMKTANYCGDGAVHTIAGTEITISDPVEPPRHWEFGKSEAIWSETKALCIEPTQLRHPEFALGCALPTCQPEDWAKMVNMAITSGLPSGNY